MINLTIPLSLPEEVVAYLQEKAQLQQVTIADIVLEAIDAYAEQATELSNEQILDNSETGMLDALKGHTHPADDVLAELRQKLSLNADQS